MSETETRLLEERDARLAQVTAALRDLHRVASMLPASDPALDVALLGAKLALEMEPGPMSREQVCCARMPGGVFCTRRTGHGGDHEGVAPRPVAVSDFGPEQARKRRY